MAGKAKTAEQRARAAEEASLASLIRFALEPHVLEEKRMFGGTCFLAGGHMVCGTFRNEVLVRVGAGGVEEALKRPGVAPFLMHGRAMSGFVMVSGAHLRTPEDAAPIIGEALAFVSGLPPKKKR